MIRRLTVILLSGVIFSLGVMPVLAQKMPSPTSYATLQEYEKATGEKMKGFDEAPMLRVKVAAGELPSVEERLPEEPLVINPVEEIGQYGGTIRTPCVLTNMAVEVGWMNVESMLQVDADAVHIIPQIAKGYEFSKDGKTFTLYLRKGMKWSDGHPYTADDVMFWWEDFTLNKDLSPILWVGWSPGEKPMEVEKIDEYTVSFHFAVPYLNFVYRLLGDRALPKHYLKNFHPQYIPKGKLEEMTKKEGYDNWWELFKAKSDWVENVDLPVVNAWRIVKITTEAGFLERNPYYWKVDTAGNQLPYIDKVVGLRIIDREVANMKIISGEVDYACAAMKLENYPLYMENKDKGDYQVMLWDLLFQSATGFMFNLTENDPILRKVFQDVRFRRAMSLAINREEINEAVFFGLGIPMQSAMPPGSRFYNPEFAKAYAEYSPEKANRLLDEMGLTKRDRDGYRLRSDEKTLSIYFECTDIGAARGLMSIWPLTKNYWKEIGVKTDLKLHERTFFDTRLATNEVSATMWGITGVLDAELFTTGSWLVISEQSWWGNSWWGMKWYDWFNTKGQEGEEPPKEIKRLYELFNRIQVSPSEEERNNLIEEILRSQAENLWMIGTVANIPQPIAVKNHLRNFSEKSPWTVYGHGYMPSNPCQWFLRKK